MTALRRVFHWTMMFLLGWAGASYLIIWAQMRWQVRIVAILDWLIAFGWYAVLVVIERCQRRSA